MKDYDIQTIEYNGCKTCIIFSTHYISPLKYIKEIQLEYSELLKECNEVYFDFLLSRRNSNERFAKMICNAGLLEQFEYIRISKKDPLRKISAGYYRTADVDWTYCSDIKKKLIMRGLVI